ncbi:MULTISPECIES: hypothetical protein [unclassified Bifidobacterium]|nr:MULTISPECIES: hypothetical protein [unclassified Bifidobacterium]WEV66274.1 hypothetical protein OZX71_02715 [Bifidobacterium sp. ESL0764]WEV76446.1 hypothetical protein OZX75_04530 [Bifidobacterium sp. ESL0800]
MTVDDTVGGSVMGFGAFGTPVICHVVSSAIPLAGNAVYTWIQ